LSGRKPGSFSRIEFRGNTEEPEELKWKKQKGKLKEKQ
jgi:hypothetical protein